MTADRNLVLLPGSLCDEAVWDHQVKAFSLNWRITVPHLVGYDSLTDMAEAVLAKAPARFTLVGFSMGGRVALEMMRATPERIERLVLVDASVHPVADGEAGRRQELIDLAFAEGMEAVAKVWLPRLVHPSRRDDAALMGFLSAMACRFTPEDYQNEVHALVTRPDARPVLAQIQCPTLILAGRQDPLSTPERNLETARQIAGAELVMIEDCGHFPMLEAPEQTDEVLKRWLNA